MSQSSDRIVSSGLAGTAITFSGEDSASCQNNHHMSSPHVRHQRVPDRITVRASVLPERIGYASCDGDSGWKTHHEVCEAYRFGIGTSETPRGLSPFSSASLYLKTQTSTPWAMFAKSRRSTFIWRYSIRSGGRVIVIDTFLRTIMHVLNVQNNAGNWSYINRSAHLERAEVPLYGSKPISGSYGRDQDDKEIRGDPSGGKQDPDSVSGAEHPCSSLGCADPFLGAGVGFTHEEGRFCGGISSVRILIRRCVA